MDPRLQRRVQRYGWDKAASHYDRGWQRQLAPAQARLLALADLRAGERVLDIACGTGVVTFAAAAAVGTTGSVLGTDLSDEMIRIARERSPGAHVRFERMDAEQLAAGDASFDAALCALGLMYVPDPGRAVGEMRRVAGRAVAAVWGARKRCGWADIFPIVDARVRSEVCPLFFALGTGDSLRALFEEAGFTDLVGERIDATLVYDSGDEACDAAFAGGPVALAYSRFDDTVRREVRAEYLASIAGYRDGEGYRVPGEFVVVAGRAAAR
ncbi:MAG TPA: methyltransferase domain-containing protein [Kofleriaceae bacterium]|nr:methyltransferase domain-containing protein [Kofleriaceae bacterium]